MRNLLIIIVLLVLISCKAKTIVPLGEPNALAFKSGTYNKDVDNDFGKYVGTWKFQQGTTSLIIVLKTKLNYYYSTKNYYKDILIGEYRYIENGTEKINTLNQLGQAQATAGDYNISGSLIIYGTTYPKCDDCGLDERRIKLAIKDPERTYLINAIVLRYKNENGTEKIIAKIFKNGTSFMPPDNAPDEMRVPYGEYVLIKQP